MSKNKNKMNNINKAAEDVVENKPEDLTTVAEDILNDTEEEATPEVKEESSEAVVEETPAPAPEVDINTEPAEDTPVEETPDDGGDSNDVVDDDKEADVPAVSEDKKSDPEVDDKPEDTDKTPKAPVVSKNIVPNKYSIIITGGTDPEGYERIKTILNNANLNDFVEDRVANTILYGSFDSEEDENLLNVKKTLASLGLRSEVKLM